MFNNNLFLVIFFFNTVEGFTEAKVERFGQAIINKVIEVCNKVPIDTKTDDENACTVK